LSIASAPNKGKKMSSADKNTHEVMRRTRLAHRHCLLDPVSRDKAAIQTDTEQALRIACDRRRNEQKRSAAKPYQRPLPSSASAFLMSSTTFDILFATTGKKTRNQDQF
jgi:hypothetical protein